MKMILILICSFTLLLSTASGLSSSPRTKLMMASSSSSSPKAPKPFALNAKISILPEKREEWLKQIKKDQECSRRDEEGCLQFSLSEDIESPNTFYLHEQYVDKRAFLAHTQTPHFKQYDEYCKAENPVVGEMELCTFRPLDEGENWSISKRDVPKSAYCVSVNLYPKEEVRDEFLKVIANNKKGTDETEPLALQYTYGESTAKSNVFHFYEQYSGEDGGKEGFDAHAAAPHFKDWEKFVGTDPFVKDPEVYFSRIIED